MRRVVSVWLPTWPTDRLRKASRQTAPSRDRPFVVAIHDGRRRVLSAVDAAASAEGLAPGMTLAHARMLVADLAVAEADPNADLAGLNRLALWCQKRYSPLTAAAPPASLWLDVTGCTHLWGSEEALLENLRARLERAGFTCRVAMADTPAAAHAVAAFGRRLTSTVPPGETVAHTSSLPIASLRPPPDTIAALARLGFETVGDLMRAPRPQLALRFGDEVGRRLDQLTGARFEPIEPLAPSEAVRRRVAFVEPISTAEAIRIGMEKLVGQIHQDLEARGLGARQVDLTCECVDGRRQAVRVGTARPTRDQAHLMRLLGPRIETIAPGFGIEAMSLAVALAQPLKAAMTGSLVDREPDMESVAVLVDALANRLGPDRVYRVAAAASDVPERSVRRVPPLAPPSSVPWQIGAPRPVRLLERPEPVEAIALMPDDPPTIFFWRQERRVVRRADGPERIHGEWWRGDREVDALRDYFRVEDDQGSRFWLFRTGVANDARWFIHGVFGC